MKLAFINMLIVSCSFLFGACLSCKASINTAANIWVVLIIIANITTYICYYLNNRWYKY